MIRVILTLAGGALLIAGGLDLFAGARPDDPFAAAWCLSSGLTPPEPGRLEWLGHCWGCYAVLAGLVSLLAGLRTGAPGVRPRRVFAS